MDAPPPSPNAPARPGPSRTTESPSPAIAPAREPVGASARAGTQSTHTVLELQRNRAERMLNRARLIVLSLLAIAALVYAPSLTRALNTVNVALLAPMIVWTLIQNRIYHRRTPHALPGWLTIVNPIADITAVTAILGAYASAQSASLALKTPMFLTYFVILASLPIAASTRKAAAVAVLACVEYGTLVGYFLLSGRLNTVLSPVSASSAPLVSPLDEGAKLLLLAVAGAVATYATNWQERLATSFWRATLEREQVEARLARAQLQSLRLQLHPHFLFNTLNTITALVNADPRKAERVISGLSELLRISLNSASEQEVPLSRELETLEHYIGIQQIRFQDRLRVSFDIETETRAALVPNLLLQPLVENAIRHGIAPRASPGHVRIRVQRRDAVLAIDVIDDGVGEDPHAEHRDGVGLGNTRARLLSLYGSAHHFEARGRSEGGFVVAIEMPFRTDANTRTPMERSA